MRLRPLLVYKYNEFLKDHNELESFDNEFDNEFESYDEGMNLKDNFKLLQASNNS